MINEKSKRVKMLPISRSFKNTFTYYQRRFKLIAGIVALPLSFYFVATVLSSFEPTLFWGAPFNLLGFVSAILSVLAIYQAMIDGSEHEIMSCYRHSWQKIGSFVWLALISSLIVFGGLLLGIIPGVILSIWFIFSAIILFAEEGRGSRGLNALVRSRNYVRGYWWPILGRIMIFSIPMALLSFIVMGILGWLLGANPTDFSRNVGNEWANLFRLVLIYLFLLPMQIAYFYSLFLQLKKIKAEDETVNRISKKTKNWFVGLGIFGLVMPFILLLMVSMLALGGILGFLLSDDIINTLPLRVWLYNNGWWQYDSSYLLN